MRHDLAWLLGELAPDAFFDTYFEKQPLHLTDRAPAYYDTVFAPADLVRMIHQSADALLGNLLPSHPPGEQSGLDRAIPTSGPELLPWIRDCSAVAGLC